MPSMTVLEMVQNILSSLDSDEVNSINDTLESVQIAKVIETTYYNIMSGRDWPHLYELFRLSPSGTSARPTHMSIPDGYMEMAWVKYNQITSDETKANFQTIPYKTPEDFFDYINSRDETLSTVDEITDPSGVVLKISNDVSPKYYTTFDGTTIVFDSYDSDLGVTLLESSTQCFGKKEPSFTISDTFVPDIPPSMFSYLLSEAKATCFLELKQMPHQKAEQNSITQRRRLSQDSWKVVGGITYSNYGRKGKK